MHYGVEKLGQNREGDLGYYRNLNHRSLGRAPPRQNVIKPVDSFIIYVAHS